MDAVGLAARRLRRQATDRVQGVLTLERAERKPQATVTESPLFEAGKISGCAGVDVEDFAARL